MVLLLPLLGCSTPVSPIDGVEEPVPVDASYVGEPVDTTPLLEIEKSALPACIVEGPWTHETLPEYYWAENADLRARFEQARQASRGTPPRTFRALTLVSGAAGVGKTFVKGEVFDIKGEVFDEDYPENAVYSFDMRELFSLWAARGIALVKADLHASGTALNRLLTVPRKQHPHLRTFLEAKDAQFYVIDSLDEIHPEDYSWVLRQVEEFVFDPEREFVHVVIFGRGLAFRDYWALHQERNSNRDVRLFLLHEPQLKTTGDLMVSSWSYHTWRYGLRWAPEEGEPETMPLREYAEWVNSGFSRSGKFASVTCDENNSMRPDVHRALVDLSKDSRVVGSVLNNLAGNTLMREVIEEDVLAGREYDERHVMESFLQKWLVRDTRADDRPSAKKAQYLELYLTLLQQVAVRYLHENALDESGFFEVREEDAVLVDWHGKELIFRVNRILDRSGLKFVNPRDPGMRYRFEPLWFHRLLVEMHNDRETG
jgi:hypothetical protein